MTTPYGSRDLLVADATRVHLFRGYGWVTKGVRVVLIVAMGAVLLTVLAWPSLEEPSVTAPPPDVSTVNNELIGPRYEAVDASGQPFVITAALALQNRDHQDLIDLTDPQGVLTLKSGTTLTLTAPRGFYRQAQKILDLAGGVRLVSTDGQVVTTDAITLDLTAQTLEGQGAVMVESPMGVIKAARLSGVGAGMVLTFHGPATLILNEGSSE